MADKQSDLVQGPPRLQRAELIKSEWKGTDPRMGKASGRDGQDSGGIVGPCLLCEP